MNILITGGAGYIGSTLSYYFIDRGHNVFIIDNLINGSKDNIPLKSTFFLADISDKKELEKIFIHKFDVVIHCASLVNNEESVLNAEKFKVNNYLKSKIFLDYCLKFKIKNFIFSSTAAVYGNHSKKIKECFSKNPLAPYGKFKLKFENYLKKQKINYIIFRYFNVVGTDRKKRCGFQLQNNNLFLNIFKKFEKNKTFYIHGNDYETIDGTPVRDFIHVEDLSKIHYFFTKNIKKKNYSKIIINCGYGIGYSVQQVVNEFKKKNKNLKYKYAKRKRADIGFSVSNIDKLRKFKNLCIKQRSLKEMINSSYNWYKIIK